MNESLEKAVKEYNISIKKPHPLLSANRKLSLEEVVYNYRRGILFTTLRRWYPEYIRGKRAENMTCVFNPDGTVEKFKIN